MTDLKAFFIAVLDNDVKKKKHESQMNNWKMLIEVSNNNDTTAFWNLVSDGLGKHVPLNYCITANIWKPIFVRYLTLRQPILMYEEESSI